MAINTYGCLFKHWYYCPNITRTVAATDVQEEAAKYEQYYEVILNNALSDYYRRGTFIVDAKATLERVLVPRGYEVIEGEEPVRIENLPGLPFVPQIYSDPLMVLPTA